MVKRLSELVLEKKKDGQETPLLTQGEIRKYDYDKIKQLTQSYLENIGCYACDDCYSGCDNCHGCFDAG